MVFYRPGIGDFLKLRCILSTTACSGASRARIRGVRRPLPDHLPETGQTGYTGLGAGGPRQRKEGSRRREGVKRYKDSDLCPGRQRATLRPLALTSFRLPSPWIRPSPTPHLTSPSRSLDFGGPSPRPIPPALLPPREPFSPTQHQSNHPAGDTRQRRFVCASKRSGALPARPFCLFECSSPPGIPSKVIASSRSSRTADLFEEEARSFRRHELRGLPPSSPDLLVSSSCPYFFWLIFYSPSILSRGFVRSFAPSFPSILFPLTGASLAVCSRRTTLDRRPRERNRPPRPSPYDHPAHPGLASRLSTSRLVRSPASSLPVRCPASRDPAQ